MERLDRAYADADAASSEDFFRRLRDFWRLVDEDDVISVAAERMKAEVEAAHAQLNVEDEAVIHDLVEHRRELARLAPEVDDSSLPRPPGSRLDPEVRRALDTWTWTLSNFDAISTDAEGKLVETRNLDDTKARMLGEILNAKLYSLQYPEPSRRADLDDLYDAVNAARERHTTAQQHLEEVTQSSGFLARLRIASLAPYLKRREVAPAKTEDEKRERAEAILVEVGGDLHHLREAVRPEGARGPLDPEARGALERYESDFKKALTDLHRALRPRVEEVEVEAAPKGWAALDTSQKIQVFAIGVAFLGIVIGAIVTISVAG